MLYIHTYNKVSQQGDIDYSCSLFVCVFHIALLSSVFSAIALLCDSSQCDFVVALSIRVSFGLQERSITEYAGSIEYSNRTTELTHT